MISTGIRTIWTSVSFSKDNESINRLPFLFRNKKIISTIIGNGPVAISLGGSAEVSVKKRFHAIMPWINVQTSNSQVIKPALWA